MVSVIKAIFKNYFVVCCCIVFFFRENKRLVERWRKKINKTNLEIKKNEGKARRRSYYIICPRPEVDTNDGFLSITYLQLSIFPLPLSSSPIRTFFCRILSIFHFFVSYFNIAFQLLFSLFLFVFLSLFFCTFVLSLFPIHSFFLPFVLYILQLTSRYATVIWFHFFFFLCCCCYYYSRSSK